jgi:hypothetical protein
MTARLVWGACLVLGVATLVLLALGAGVTTHADSFGISGFGGMSFVVASLAFATVGAMVTTRVPGNPIGPLFLVTGVIVGAGDLAFQYADRTVFIAPGAWPGDTFAAWVQNLGLPPSFGLLAVALLLFPDGRLPSTRWRPALWLALAGIALIVIGYGLRPGPLDDPFESISNPFGVGSFELMDAVTGFGWMFMAAGVGLAAVAMTIRFRRSHGLERQQFKWLSLAAAIAGVAIVADAISFFAGVEGIEQSREVVLGLGFCVFPLSAGAAILRYRLYDIDVVINRALVYAALTATLAGAYVGSVLLLQLVLSPSSDFAIVASTLAVAGLFQPARRWIQEIVDRRFYRRKYDAQRTLEGFGVRLRAEVELESVSAELLTVVADTMQPTQVSLWVRRTS